MYSLVAWIPGHSSSTLWMARAGGARNKKQESATIQNMTTKISCLDKPRFLTRNPPTQKDPLKQCSKQQVYNLKGGSLPNVVQTAKATRRKPTKTQQL